MNLSELITLTLLRKISYDDFKLHLNSINKKNITLTEYEINSFLNNDNYLKTPIILDILKTKILNENNIRYIYIRSIIYQNFEIFSYIIDNENIDLFFDNFFCVNICLQLLEGNYLDNSYLQKLLKHKKFIEYNYNQNIILRKVVEYNDLETLKIIDKRFKPDLSFYNNVLLNYSKINTPVFDYLFQKKEVINKVNKNSKYLKNEKYKMLYNQYRKVINF
jgi:hypothetical protein